MKAKARAKRLGYPVRAYVGPMGTGKSALLVYDAIANMERGRPQLSTVRLLDYKNPRECEGGPLCDDPDKHTREVMRTTLVPFDPDDPTSPLVRHSEGTGEWVTHKQAHPLYVPMRDLRQFLTWRDGDILCDEVQGLFNSRESSSMPSQVLTMMMQLRRLNVSLSWSVPAWGRADSVLREQTQLVTMMTAALPTRAPATADGLPRLWHRRRLFTARSYDPSCMDEFEAHRAMAEEVHPEIIAFYWGPGSTMFNAYDTLDGVASVGYSSDTGMCMTCSGKRRSVLCSCDDHRVTASGRRGVQAASEARPSAPVFTPSTPLPLLP